MAAKGEKLAFKSQKNQLCFPPIKRVHSAYKTINNIARQFYVGVKRLLVPTVVDNVVLKDMPRPQKQTIRTGILQVGSRKKHAFCPRLMPLALYSLGVNICYHTDPH